MKAKRTDLNVWGWTPPLAASFSLQSGDATNLTLADDADVGMTIASGAFVNSDIQRFAYRTLTTPSGDWDMKANFEFEMNTNFQALGFLIRDNTGGRNLSMQFSGDGTNRVDKGYATSMTAFSARSQINGSNHAGMSWLRLAKVGTNLLFYVSRNGKQWRLVLTESVTAHLAAAPNRVGFFTRTGTNDLNFAIPYFSLTGTAV